MDALTQALKLSGLRPLAYEQVEGGWNVAIEFPEQRPKGTNPVYKGELGALLALVGRGSKGKRLEKALEIVFFPALKYDTTGYFEGMVVNKGSHIVKGFSRFFRQAQYDQLFNSLRWAKKVGSMTTPNKVADEYNTNDFLVIQKDSEGNVLETSYPKAYVLIAGEWVPQMVINIDQQHKMLCGTPSRVEEPVREYTVVPTVSGDEAGVSHVWNPINAINRGTGGKHSAYPESSTEEMMDKIKAEQKVKETSTPFNPPRIIAK